MKLAIIPEPKSAAILPGTVPRGAETVRNIDAALEAEAYRISIGNGKITLSGESPAALRRTEATLEQIRTQCPDALPCAEISDAPAFPYRSFHIDCSRHFFPVDELKKMMEAAAFFKLNRFHWTFSNDQGWRIECGRFPKLHEIGAYRDGDHSGNYHSDAREGGYYIREEVRDLVNFAGALGVEIVPELDIPGHVTAILAAYPELSCAGNPVKVGTRAGIYRDILCPGKDGVFSFLEALLDDLLELFPGPYFHIGGDEAPKSRWEACPFCRRRMREQGLSSFQQLQGWFENRVIAYLKARGKTVLTWNEAAYGDNLDPDAVLQLWTEDKAGHAARHSWNGGHLLLSPMYNAYCDYPYGLISLKSLYEPELSPAGLDRSRIIGTECLLWTEYVRTDERLEELAWPRFAASAEVGWCGDSKPGYEDFAGRLRTLFPIFERFGIHATAPEGWTPEGERREKELEAFRENLIPGISEDYKEATDAI